MQRSHIVQAVSELNEKHPHVIGNGKEQLAEIFRLLFFLRCEWNLADLRYAVDDVGNFRAEEFFDFFQRRKSVFDDIVQKTDADRNRVHLHFG